MLPCLTLGNFCDHTWYIFFLDLFLFRTFQWVIEHIRRWFDIIFRNVLYFIRDFLFWYLWGFKYICWCIDIIFRRVLRLTNDIENWLIQVVLLDSYGVNSPLLNLIFFISIWIVRVDRSVAGVSSCYTWIIVTPSVLVLIIFIFRSWLHIDLEHLKFIIFFLLGIILLAFSNNRMSSLKMTVLKHSLWVKPPPLTVH